MGTHCRRIPPLCAAIPHTEKTSQRVAVADEKYFNHRKFPFCNALKCRNLRCFGRVLLHYIFHTAFFSTILDYIFLLNFWKIRLFIKIHFLFIQYSREYMEVLEMQVQNFYLFDSFRLVQTKIQLNFLYIISISLFLIQTSYPSFFSPTSSNETVIMAFEIPVIIPSP